MNLVSLIPSMRSTVLDLADLQAQRNLLHERMIFHSVASSEYGKLLKQAETCQSDTTALKSVLEMDLQYHIAKAFDLSLQLRVIDKKIGRN